VGGLDLPDPFALAPGLRAALGQVVDPRANAAGFVIRWSWC